MLLALNWSKALTMLMKKDNFQFLKKGDYYAYCHTRFRFTGPPKLEANHLT